NEGETLESFVDSELTFEREAHRAWLASVMSGREQSPPPEPVKSPIRATSTPAQAMPAVRVSPLVDSTTLVPNVGDPSQPMEAVVRPKRTATWALVGVIAFFGSFLGYRLVMQSDKTVVVQAMVPAEEHEQPQQQQAIARVEDQKPVEITEVET